MGDPIFVLDANVFMEAARRYYAFDLVPKFWDNLVLYAKNGRIESIDRIKQEVGRGKDDLATWAKGTFHTAFVSTNDNSVIKIYSDIMNWISNQTQYFDAAKTDFAKGADGWLVAYAKAMERIVVTQEVPSPDARRKVPIPNVCQAFNVQFTDTFGMLRLLGVRLG